MIGAAVYAMANISNRRLKQVHYTVIGFYHTLFGIVMLGSYLLYQKMFTDETVFHLFNREGLFYMMFFTSILGVLEYNTRNVAYQVDSSGFIALISYTNVFYGFVADIFIFKQQIEWWDYFGAGLIVTVCAISALYKLH